MKKDFGLVSIIMPTYNSARFIDETLQSVFAQTYTNWEIVVVDNGSTDDTLEKIKKYNDHRIRVFVNEVNKGQAYSRNRAIDEANGRFIAFLDSDDIWTPDKLQIQLEYMAENNYLACYSNYIEIDEKGNEIGAMVSGPKKMTAKFYDRHYGYIGFLTSIYDCEKIGKVHSNPNILSACADQALLYRVMERGGDFFLINKVLAKYRIVSGSPSHSGKWRSLKYQYTYYKIDRNKNSFAAWVNAFRKGVFYVFGKRLKYRRRYQSIWEEN